MPDVMVITGSSRGIGAATARLAARAGYAVCVNYLHNAKAAGEVVDDIVSAGGEAIAVHGDMSVEADIIRLFRTVDQDLGRLAVLVNNAGIVGDAPVRVQDVTAARLQAMFALNITGYFLCAREAIRRMSTAQGGQGGAIVNISSAAARLGSPGEWVDYAASKGAVDTMTIGLAREVAGEGIRVNAVRPGLIRTDIHASGGQPDRLSRLEKTVPIQRAGTPEEVAETVLWLASDAASYVTGALVDVSGGR